MEDLIVVLWLIAMVAIIIWVSWYYTKKRPINNKKFDDPMKALASRLGRKIVEVKLLGAGSTDYRSFGGAVVGGVVAGSLGAVIGGTHGGGGKQKQRFAIKYDDGSVVIKEVRTNSREFNELMKYVDWDDIK